MLSLALLSIACAPERAIDIPPESEAPEPTIPEQAPNPDGDYILYTAVGTQYCNDVTNLLPDKLIGTADIVPQSEPDTFDLTTSTGGWLSYDLCAQERSSADGSFTLDEKYYATFWPDTPVLTWKRRLDGHIWDGVEFNYAFELGSDDRNGDYETYCRVDSTVWSERRYALRTDVLRRSIGGKWRVKKTVLYDSWSDDANARMRLKTPSDAPDLPDSPESGFGFRRLETPMSFSPPADVRSPMSSDARYVTLDVIPHDDDGSWFSIRGTYFSFDPLRTPDGNVDVFIWYSNGHLMTLTGTVTDEVLDLEFYWRWFDPLTDETVRELRIRYEGVPRYDPPVAPKSIFGEYISTYRVVEDTCDDSAGQWRRVTDTLPSGDAKVRLGLTGRYAEPSLDLPETGGVFSYDFTYKWGREMRYRIDGAISPHFLDATIQIDVYALWGDEAGDFVCRVIYAVEEGTKRFRAFGEEAP